MNLRLPSINSPTAEGAIQQIKSYLFQVVQQINIEINSTQSVTAEETEAIINNIVNPLEQRIKRLEVLFNNEEE